LNKNTSQTALAALGARLIGARGNLSEALEAAAKVVHGLPTPSIWDYMAPPTGMPLPATSVFEPSPVPPNVVVPLAVLQGIESIKASDFPEPWVETLLEQITRLERASCFRGLYNKCVDAVQGREAPDLAKVDPVVAGLLLRLLHPPTNSPIRSALFAKARRHFFGGLLIAEEMSSESERNVILTLLSSNSRWLFWLSRLPGWCNNSLDRLPNWLDLYSGLIRLPTSMGRAWLENMMAAAFCGMPEAASAALVLQPGAGRAAQAVWVETIQRAPTGWLAVQTVFLAKSAWPAAEWGWLREQLREKATFDRAQCWFHWYARISPEGAEDAAADPKSDLLWCIELVSATKVSEEGLRARLDAALSARPFDREALWGILWLDSRQTPL
jgi:hypothetical protein